MATLPGLRVSLTLDSATFIAETRRVNASIERLGTSFASVRRSLDTVRAGFAALGAGLVLRNIVQATTQFERINSTLRAGTGSADAAARGYQFVREEAARLGLDLGTAAEQFGKLTAASRGTTIQGQGARDIFTAVAEAMLVLGRNAEQSEGAFRAIEQVMSKGKVQAEELRGQLGERLPGAFQIAARAMGVTTAELNKMLERGEVVSEDFLPKFAAELRKTFGPEVAQASQNLQASLNRLNTAVFEFTAQVGQGGVAQAITEFSRGLTDAAQGSENLARQLGADLGVAIRAIGEAALFAARHFRELMTIVVGFISFKVAAFFLQLGVAITSAAKAVLFLNAAMLRNPLTLIAGAIALAVASLYEFRDATIQVGDRTTTVGNLAIDVWNGIVSALAPVIAGLQKVAELVGAVFEAVGISVAQAAQPFDALTAKLSVVQDQLREVREVADSLIAAGITPATEITDEIARLEAQQASLVNQLDAAQLAQKNYQAAVEETTPAIAAHTAALSETGKAADDSADALARMLDEAERENGQLNALKRAYDGYGSSVERVEETIAAMNDAQQLEAQLRSAKIPLVNAEVAGLTELASKNSVLRRELEKRAAVEKEIAALKESSRVAGFEAINDEELGRRIGQLQSTDLSRPGLPPELVDEKELSEPFKNALQSVQAEFTNTFDEISQGTIRSFEDMAESIHGIFTNMNANLLSLAIFDPTEFDKISARIRTDTGLPVSSGLLGGAAAATPLIGLASGLFGNQGSQQGISFGGAGGAAIGGIAGSFFGPGGTALGAIGGGLLGSITGGLLGGFLGGSDKDKSKGAVSGGLGRLSGRGEQLGEITKVLQQFDDQILGLLTSRQKALVDASLKARKSAVEVNFKGELTDDVIRSATGQRARAIGTGLGFSNIQSAEDIGAALQTQRAIEELTNSTALFARQIEETSAQFVELRGQGRQFGISIAGLAEAQTKAVADLRKAQDAQIAALIDPFKALLAPLDAFKSRLDFTGLNPAEQFARAQADFQRISAEAAAGSIPAIQQFESAADLFVQLANQVGASPGQAAAVSQVEAALSEIRDSITKAQADASRGVEDILDRADRNNTVRLDQLIELAQEQIRLQKKGGSKI